jgi:hypothetical protein
MKIIVALLMFSLFSIVSFNLVAQTSKADGGRKNLYIDVHQLKPGQVKYSEVAKAHAKDLATQGKYDAQFLKFWVNEEQGLVYCLVSANDSESIRKTHAEAHGLLPDRIYPVTGGMEAALKNKKDLFMDIHYLGAGNVTAKAAADAHQKDLAVQKKYGVNFVNYWVDEKAGVVMCLAEAKDSTSIIKAHKEAHGLLPAKVTKVKQGE